jgi:hypothetical protein
MPGTHLPSSGFDDVLVEFFHLCPDPSDQMQASRLAILSIQGGISSDDSTELEGNSPSFGAKRFLSDTSSGCQLVAMDWPGFCGVSWFRVFRLEGAVLHLRKPKV